jgi:hypothetical protein
MKYIKLADTAEHGKRIPIFEDKINLSFCGLFYGTVSISDYIILKSRIAGE